MTPEELTQTILEREKSALRPLKAYDPFRYLDGTPTVFEHASAFAQGFFIGIFILVAMYTILGISVDAVPVAYLDRFFLEIMPATLSSCALAISAYVMGLLAFPLKRPSMFSLKLGLWYALFGLPMAGLFIIKTDLSLWLGAVLFFLACGLAPKFSSPTGG